MIIHGFPGYVKKKTGIPSSDIPVPLPGLVVVLVVLIAVLAVVLIVLLAVVLAVLAAVLAVAGAVGIVILDYCWTCEIPPKWFLVTGVVCLTFFRIYTESSFSINSASHETA